MLRTHPQCWTGRFSPVRHQHSACKSRCAFLGLWAIGYRAKSAWKTTGVSLALSRRTPRPARLMCLARAGGSRREPEGAGDGVPGCPALLMASLQCSLCQRVFESLDLGGSADRHKDCAPSLGFIYSWICLRHRLHVPPQVRL